MDSTRMKKLGTMSAMLAVALWGLSPAMAQYSQSMSKSSKSTKSAATKSGTAPLAAPNSKNATLYDRLGGMKGIEELSDNFVSNLLSHPSGRMQGSASSSATMGSTGAATGTMGSMGTSTNMSTGHGTSSSVMGTSSGGMTGKEGTGKDTADQRATTGTSAGAGMATGTSGAASGQAKSDMSKVSTSGSDATTNTTSAATTTGKMANTGAMTAPSQTVATDTTKVDAPSFLREYVSIKICEASGGACKDPATPLAAIHGRLDVTNADWSAAMNDFRTTLDKRRIPKGDQDEVMTTLDAVMHEATMAPTAGR